VVAEYDWHPTFLPPLKQSYSLLLLIDSHCGVCWGRNGFLRLHDPLIHNDEESPDLIDDRVWWGKRHPEEVYGYKA